jgi:hypothetical protein
MLEDDYQWRSERAGINSEKQRLTVINRQLFMNPEGANVRPPMQNEESGDAGCANESAGTGFWIEGNPRLRHDARSNFRSLELF